jgi:conjugative relaxase-like TrwC/TraI family protein
MFTCKKIRNGSTYLGTHLSANDYYCEQEQVSGVWVGKGAERLGIAGQTIEKEDAAFEALRLNQHPDNSGPLTPRKAENSIRFFDFQCSAQKSVSLMAIMMEDRRLNDAHDRATHKALAELERFAAIQTRQGHYKQRHTTGNLCAAAFRHDASRELDPQLHTHFVIANATWDAASQRWLALETHDIFKAIRYCGKVYQNELARECRSLGYEIEQTRNGKGWVEGFEIKGVSEELRLRYSKRRAEVEAAIDKFVAERGRKPNPAEISQMASETRSAKLREISTPEVRQFQRSQLSSQELSDLECLKQEALNRASDSLEHIGSNWRALMQARDHLYERHSVLKGHEILAEALNQNLGALDLERLKLCMASDQSGITRLAESAQNPLLSCQWASQRGLELECWSIQFVNQTQRSCSPLGTTEGTEFEFKSQEQRTVVLDTLQTTDRVYAIRGCAGAGKTTCLQEIQKGLEAAGRRAYYLAPTAAAVEVLRRDGFTDATTVHDFLTNQVRLDPDPIRQSVIIIDESSLQSTKLGASLLKTAQVHDARVLFVGDVRQHVSVEAGDFLRVLEQHSKLRFSELEDIRRQVPPEYDQAVRLMAGGKTTEGLNRLDQLGWLHEGKGDYLRQAAAAYIEATGQCEALERCIAIAPTWEENHCLTEAIRQELKQRGRLGSSTKLQVHDPVDWTRQQKTETRNYRPGMVLTLTKRVGGLEPSRPLEIERVHAGRLYLQGRAVPLDPAKHADRLQVAIPRHIELAAGDPILIRRNARKHGLINGEVLTCTAMQSDGSILTREGKTLPASFRDFAHGYVVTSHKSQGRTHDQVVVAAAQMDAKAAYVACSRGRHQVSIFTPDKAQLFDRAEQSGDRLAASDVLDPTSLRSAVWRRQARRAWEQAVEQASVLQRISQRLAPAPEPDPPEIRLPLKESEIHSPSKEPEIRLPSKQLDWPSLGMGR